MIHRVVFLVLAVTMAVASVLAQGVPNVVVERHWFHGERAYRITLFDNKMAVTTVREKEEQVFFRQLTLGDAEYEIYLDAMSEVVAEAGVKDRESVKTVDSGASVAVNIPGIAPLFFFYSPLQVLDLPTGRLVGILDDLQQRVSEASPSAEALRLWNPKVGDQLELFVGGKAEVTEVREDGVLVIEQPDSRTILIVPSFERPQVIMKVVSQ